MGAPGRTEGVKEEAVDEEGPGRANLWITDEIHRQLKIKAAEQRVTLRSLVEEYLNRGLASDKKLAVHGGNTEGK